ncbi:MAG: diguanylate cyclase [Planctomycetia bacterium]|nr:diguanylate cyclase [Planctomycetia bacterium]
MKAKPLKVLLVARSPALLAPLSKFLNLVGYVAVPTCDAAQAAAVLPSERPDFLILDADLLSEGGRELCRDICGSEARSHVLTLLLVNETATPQEITEALKLGVDDFLTKPIVFGELLSRLRAAARMLEYERRVRTQSGSEPSLALPNKAALRHALAAALGAESRRRPVALVALDLDFFKRLTYAHGQPAADGALAGVAQSLRAACHGEDLPAFAGDNRFFVLLMDRSEAEAAQWADQFRRTLAATKLALAHATETLTASFGVAACDAGALTADKLIERAEEALDAAKRSGRNDVVRRSVLDDESNAWTNLAAPGKLFERTVARDVMTPTTITLHPDQPATQAAALLRRTVQPAFPVVNDDGKLLGVLGIEDCPAGADQDRSARLVRDVLRFDPVRFDEETSFTELMNFFTHDARSLVVVVDDGRPTGIVTRDALAALSEPLTAASFAPTAECSDASDYLVVPEACTLE